MVIKQRDSFLKFLNIVMKHCDWFLKFLEDPIPFTN